MLSVGPTVMAAVAQTSSAELRQRAEELRREHRLPAALDAYRLLVVVDSGRFEDRFWVARLESWTGRLEFAESAFVHLLVERPEDYDSRLALADVRVWQGHPADARIVLEDLRRTHPADPEVIRRLEALDHAKTAPRWEADLEYFAERLRGTPGANGARLSLGVPGTGRFGWRGEATVQEKFARTESRIGGDVSFRLRPAVEVRLSARVAPGALVLPRQSYGLGLGHRVGSRVVVYADYSFLDFADADVHRLGPAAELYLGPWLLAARYAYAATRFANGGGSAGNHAGSLAAGYTYGESSIVRLFGGVGDESFAQPSRDVIGEFHAQTIGAAWRHFFTPVLGLELAYARQSRSGGSDQDAYSLRLVQRW